MKSKALIIITSFILVTLTLFNLDLVPLRREISDMEIVMVAGLDKSEDGYEISFLKRQEQSSTSGRGTGESSNKAQVISIKAKDFNTAINHLQTLTDKYITISHIKYYIVGEETIKDDFCHIVDTISRATQVRLNSKIYVAKGMTAKGFLEKASNTDFKVENKLNNMEDNFLTERVSTEASLTNMRQIALNKFKEGLLTSLEFGESEDSDVGTEIELNSEPGKETKKEIPFGFGGAAVIKDMKLLDYLSTDETAVANYIRYTNSVNMIKVGDDETFVSFVVEHLNVKVDFKFDENDIINEVILNTTFKANYEEIKSREVIFSLDSITKYEKMLNDTISKDLEKIIKKEIEMKVDFLNLREKLEFSHPYKYMKNEEDFIKYLKNSKITLNTKGMVQTTYDVKETNIYQEEKAK